MSKWSDEKLKARRDEVVARRPFGVYARILDAECRRRGL